MSTVTRLALVAALAIGSSAAPAAASDAWCYRVTPVCGAGLHALCVCGDAWRSHCAWMCVRSP